MTGVLSGSAGSAAAPSINFGDAGTGFFKESSNVLGISGAGNLSYTFSNTSFNLRGLRPARFFDSDSSNYVEIKAPSTVSSSNKTITLPDETGTLLTSATSSISATTVTTTNSRVTNLQDSSGANASTPAQIQQGRAKAWVNFNGSGTVSIRDDFNVTSITDHAAGQYTVNFESGAVANSNYAVALTTESNNNALSTAARPLIQANSRQYNTSGVRICNSNVSTQSSSDPKTFCAIVFGD